MESNKDNTKPTYATVSEMSNKIILFPELKKHIEAHFLFKECILTNGLLGMSASTLSV